MADGIPSHRDGARVPGDHRRQGGLRERPCCVGMASDDSEAAEGIGLAGEATLSIFKGDPPPGKYEQAQRWPIRPATKSRSHVTPK